MKWPWISPPFLEYHGSCECPRRCRCGCATGGFRNESLHLNSEACEQLFRCDRTKETCGTTADSFRIQPTAGTGSSPLNERFRSVGTSRKNPAHLVPQPPVEKRSFTLGSAWEIHV